jgi:hypothetical protein
MEKPKEMKPMRGARGLALAILEAMQGEDWVNYLPLKG